MKGKLYGKGRAIATALCATIAFGLIGISTARADYVAAETPFVSGVPLESLAQGPASSSINTTQLVWGSSLSVSALQLSSAGRLTVKLTDIGWPEALSSLDLLVTDMDGVWERWDGTGNLLIDINGPARLFAAVFATANGPAMPGLYHLRADFAPVPLPAAGWLLLSAIGGLAAFRRRQ